MLIESVFTTSGLPKQDRLDGFRESMTHAAYANDVYSTAPSFKGELRLLMLGEVRVWPTTFQPCRMVRTKRLIQQSDPELYHLSLPLDGVISVSQHGRQERHSDRQMYIVDSSRPSDFSASALRAIGLEVPRGRVPLAPAAVEHLLTRPLSGRSGVGALLAGLLTQIAEGARYRPSDGPRLEGVVTDLFCAMLAHHLEIENCLEPETRTRTLTLHILAFIEGHLHDVDLTPSTIAAAHHISLSHLHRLFRTEHTTVAAHIRRRRLERAHRDLINPALAAIPIGVIATRWGFKSHADFARFYRTVYGTTPSEDRQR
ncbi:helix-turn-helix domain-containing protein [Streptomyces sp. TS71-3]|uniref:helix-turn-helix domain-containing protein n=1 Tax=Streptomyces sp. TS71-3 TaxID=2733862 RepID=UPI001B1F1056|nr:helix-turn-helix domain-containing protein [Streptomyces sp. TS71-3]GHJ39433.1 transcriptional regulator [Streptomyces sp. TS71-3]